MSLVSHYAASAAKKLAGFWIFLILLSGFCGSPSVFGQASVPEPSAGREPAPPFAAAYAKNGKNLCYISSVHQVSAESTAFKLIRDRFRTVNPQVVLVEGFPAASGISPGSLVEYVRRHSKDKNLDESVYAASLAIEAGDEFIGGEPSPDEMKGGLGAKGFAMRDLFGYLVVRQIPVWKRLGKNDFRGLFHDFAKNMETAYKFDDSALMSRRAFESWYERANKKKFDFDGITPAEAGPVTDGALLTQKIGVEMDRIREESILKTLKDMTARFDRIMVVYGAQHYQNEREELSEIFGPPEFFTLPAR